MKAFRGYRTMVSVLLIAALLCAGPGWPVRTFASVDEVEEWDGEENTWDDEDNVAEPEPAASGGELGELQQQHDKLQNDLKKFQEQQKDIQSKINSAKNEKQKAEQQRDNVGTQIALTQSEISTLEEKITTLQQLIVRLEQRIEDKQADIDEKQAEIDASYALFKKRLRAKQLDDNGSVLGLLLGADSFSDLLTRTENMARIGQHDQDMMADLTLQRQMIEAEKLELEEEQQDVEAKKIEVEGDKSSYESKKKEYQAQFDIAQSQVQDIARMEQEFLADLAANQAKQKKMQEEINAVFKKIEFIKSPYAGGEMLWPLPGFTNITSNFGSRFGGKDYHTGMDISGPPSCMGAPIVAANDGTVSFVNTAHSPGVGYGIYVIIDHGVKDGQNISTLYAHCSGISVSQGQQVKRGDVIASVGSTGWSTGPHLHFEVRIGSNAVNPISYVTA